MKPERPRVLCVDDEPLVLEGLQLTLRQHCALTVSSKPLEAVGLLDPANPFVVIVSDMRMPGLSGAEFLARAREVCPDSQRILLTGQVDVTSAIQAVNQGQIFRFLTKPCSPPEFLAAVRAGIEQHRLLTAERELLDRTLRAAVATLTDALALAQPEVYGRATRMRQVVVEVARAVGLTDTWHLEVAAQLSDLGLMSLPVETARKVVRGEPLEEAERAMLARADAVGTRLLGQIPRLEPVLELLAAARATKQPPPGAQAAALLRAVLELHRLDADGTAPERALAQLSTETPPVILRALEALAQRARLGTRVLALPVAELRPGMTLLENVVSTTGALLIARGHVLTESVLERVRNVHVSRGVREPITVRPTEGS
ncbi:MAG: HD domain-containing phosphohydrolase [Myxococcota bacterium]